MEIEQGDRLVARVWRWDAERLRKDAEADHAQQVALNYAEPDYSVSVFASPVVHEPGQVEEIALRLERNLLEHRSFRYITFTTMSRLTASGFEVRLNEPPPDHYDVVLGTELNEDALTKLSAIFDENEKRKVQS